MHPEELILLSHSIKLLAELDPENCRLAGSVVKLSALDQSLIINISSPSPDTWAILKKAIGLNLDSRGWGYETQTAENPFPMYLASSWIPETTHFCQVASRYSEGYSLLQSYLGLLPLARGLS